MSGTRLRIEDLCERTGFTRRTIRYFVQAGLLEPPAGRGRGGFYDEGHLRRLLEIRGLQERGLKLRTIQRQLPAAGTAEWPQPAPPAVPRAVPGPAPRPGAAPGRPADPEGPAFRPGFGLVDDAVVREVWARYPVSSGVELLVREDVEAKAGARLAEAVRRARAALAGGNDGKRL